MVAEAQVIDLLSDSEEEQEAVPTRKVHATDYESEEEDELCCPISEEAYQEKGSCQPLVLPACGHTFSRETLESMFKLKKDKKVLCPICNTKQTVRKIEGCPPNWDTIRSLLRKAEKKSKRKPAKQSSTAVKPSKKAKKSSAKGKLAQQAATDVVAGVPVKDMIQNRKKTRSQVSSAAEAGVGQVAKVTKKKKSKMPAAKKKAAPKAPPTVSPLMASMGQEEFEERAVRLLGVAHIQRR